MQLIGFNLKKISASRSPDFKRGSINTNIEFNDVIKEKLDLLKDTEALKISFVFSIIYSEKESNPEAGKNQENKNPAQNQGEVTFEGDVLFSANKEEAKDVTKSWKKKQIPEQFRLPMINFILKKCSVKALSLEEDLNLPAHIPFPQVRKQEQNQ